MQIIQMRSNRDKILILFEGGHIAYSPTVLQLYNELEKEYDVTIFAQDPSVFTNQRPPGNNILYYQYRYGKSRYFFGTVFRILLFLGNKQAKVFNNKNEGYWFDYFFRFRPLQKLLKKGNYFRVISVDIKNLYFCTLLNQRCDFLSLELCAYEALLPKVNQRLIDCVIIQSPERFQYLFKNDIHKIFYVQNAPVFKSIHIPANRKGLVYTGTAWDAFGFFHCLEYLNKYKTETLFVLGAIPGEGRNKIEKQYSHLIKEGRLQVAETYVESEEMANLLSNYEIGFCFYNFDIDWVNNFNYQTAPSGKLFKYLASGIPVIGNDIPGFKFVTEKKCGVLIADLKEHTIQKAVDKIRDNYSFYSVNALKLAKAVSFDKQIQPYITYLKSTIKE